MLWIISSTSTMSPKVSSNLHVLFPLCLHTSNVIILTFVVLISLSKGKIHNTNCKRRFFYNIHNFFVEFHCILIIHVKKIPSININICIKQFKYDLFYVYAASYELWIVYIIKLLLCVDSTFSIFNCHISAIL